MEHSQTTIHHRVSKLGRILNVDLHYFLKSGSYLAGADVVSAVISLGTAVAFANLFPKDAYGSFQYILSVVALLDIFNLPGINTAITYGVAQGKDRSFVDAMRAKIKIGIIGSICVASWGIYTMSQGNKVIGISLLVAALFMGVADVAGSFTSYLQGKKRFDLIALSDTVIQLLSAAALIGTLFITKNLIAIISAYFISRTLLRAIFLRFTIKKVPLNNEHDPGIIRYGMHLTVMEIGQAISGNIDRLLLWHFLGPVQVAIYTFAITIPLRAVGSLRVINRLAFPRMAASKETAQDSLLKKVGLLLIFTTSCAVMYVFAAPYIFKLFFPKYMEAVIFTQFAAVFIALQPLSLLSTSLAARAKQKALYVHSIVVPVTQTVLLSICIPFLFIKGAVLALILTRTIEGVLLLYLYRKTRAIR